MNNSNTEGLAQKKCVPCEGNTPSLKSDEIKNLAQELNHWTIVDDIRLEKTIQFKNFRGALDFVNKVGEIAEQENHHPNISIHDWNKITLSLYTHAIKGLSENDFIIAAKIDQLLHQ